MTTPDTDAIVTRLESLLDGATEAARDQDWTEALLYLQEALAVAKTLPTKPGYASPATAVEAALGDLITRSGRK